MLMEALGTSALRASSATSARFPDAWLFAAASQAVMIVEIATGSVIEANPAATSLLGMTRAHLLGAPFLNAFAADCAPALAQSLASARLTGSAKRISARARDSRGSSEIGVTLSLVRAGPDSYLLVHLLTSPPEAPHTPGAEVSSIVLDAIEQAPEGFVVTDLGLRLTYANRAFIEMAGLESQEELHGKSLAVWLEFSQAELSRLHAQMARREAVTDWKTMMRRSNLSIREVEISAVAVPDGPLPCWGFRISATRRVPVSGPT